MQGATKRVEICGGIASGKTTLVHLLQEAGLAPIYENFRANPFYDAFYRDPGGTAFETEVTFLLQHYHQQKRVAAYERRFCSDFSLVLDHAYACVTLPRDELRLFRLVLQHVEEKLPPQSLLIHLDCPPQIELARIKRRHRSAERTISVDYLAKLNSVLGVRVKALCRSVNLLVIDSSIVDFAHRQSAKTDVLRRVTNALKAI